jgi:hypothetical protein
MTLRRQLQQLQRSQLQEEEEGHYPLIISASPATGILYVTKNSLDFISGHVRMRGRENGRYPYRYLEMIDNLFGKEPNTIEVCSRSISNNKNKTSITSVIQSTALTIQIPGVAINASLKVTSGS